MIDVKTAPGLNVGYIIGVGDQVPPAIEQFGAKLTSSSPDELAWGDLSKYDVIMTGVRAYERRDDLRATISACSITRSAAARSSCSTTRWSSTSAIRSVSGEGQRQPRLGRDRAGRSAGAGAPGLQLSEQDRARDLGHWVQERGLYFLGEKDKKYVDLVSMVDSFPDNPGEKLGSLVEGKTGKGRWIYLGLGLWRQLPAGTDGAYQLLANLISLGRLCRECRWASRHP